MKIRLPKSIATTLLVWFLVIAIFPLLGVAWYAYANAVSDIETMQRHKLESTSSENVEFINSWFDQTYKNLDMWSQNEPTQKYLMTLEREWRQSGKTLHAFTSSAEYQKLLEIHDDQMVRIRERYDYVYDLFLIDLKGNILSTVTKEPDLGTNLLNGPYQNTRFAQSYRATLEDKKAHFSDLEYYAPSNGEIAGFICIPMHGPAGEIVGIMALQLRPDVMIKKFSSSTGSMKHYLVGDEGLLRTPIESKEEILRRRISSKQFWIWYNDHALFLAHSADIEEEAFIYMGPSGHRVLGQHQEIEFLGVKWVQITEVDEKILYEAPRALAQKIASILLLSIAIIAVLSVYISRRIVKPILVLSSASVKYLAGVKGIQVGIESDDEIGKFGRAFNALIQKQEYDEENLEHLAQKAQKALELQKAVFENAGASIITTDIYSFITGFNAAAEEMLGYTAQEMIGKQTFGVFVIKADYDLPNSHESTYVRKDGREVPVYLSVTTLKDIERNTTGYIAIANDVSVFKEAAEQMLMAKEAAEASVRTKSEFLATMSHEIRTPMNGVLGMLGLLSHSALDETQRQHVRVASSSANSLLGLINDILDFSKVEAGKMELYPIEFNLCDELGEFVEGVAFRAQEKGLELILNTACLTRRTIIADPGRLRQILTNLIGNAIKFTDQGEILITVSLEEVDAQNGRLHIDVSDSGIGIASDKIDKIFETFTQADGSTTRKYGGTGLGLAIVKKLCELMDGTISITSVEHEGSVFHVDIGVGLGEVSSVSIPSVSVAGKSVLVMDDNETNRTEIEWPSNIRILLVEDNLTNQIVTQGMLNMIGLEADIANNGLEALDAMQLAPYTCILMDCQMPQMDGYTASVAIREGRAGETYKEVPIIAMTANAMAGDREKCLICGMSDYVSKPIDFNTLKEKLVKWLDGKVGR